MDYQIWIGSEDEDDQDNSVPFGIDPGNIWESVVEFDLRVGEIEGSPNEEPSHPDCWRVSCVANGRSTTTSTGSHEEAVQSPDDHDQTEAKDSFRVDVRSYEPLGYERRS
jgi:hypothetical protein